MKPKKLKMTNFGPFIEESLDFDQVSVSGLFLISGKTGAGKTTIFDGMTFALFGETSGNMRTGKEMRSMFALPTEETSVAFTFEHQSLLYEIIRRPEQIVAKKRGEGVTNQAAKVQLTIFDASGKEVKQISKRNEVDQFIKELLQLDAKQFFQIMMLPQGEFRNFLIASSNDKEKVLRNLFGTQLYQSFNEWLKDQQKAQNKTLEQQQNLAEQLLNRFEWLDEQSVLSTAEALKLWSKDLKKQDDIIHTLRKQKNEIDQAYNQAEVRFYQAKEVDQLRHEQENLLQKQVTLNESQTIIDQKKKKVAALSWAAEKQHLWHRRIEKKAAYDETKAQLSEAQRRLHSLQQELKAWQDLRPTFNQLKDTVDQTLTKHRAFEGLLPIAQQAQKQQQTLTQLLKEEKRQQNKRQQFDSEQKQIEDQEIQLTAQIAAAGDYQSEKIQLLTTKNLLEKWQQTKAQHQKANNGYQKLKEQEKNCLKEQARLETQATALQVTLKTETSQNAKMQIARLQLLLEPGEACPVCGAKDHPITQTHLSYTIDDIMESEQTLMRTQQALTATKEQLSANQTLLQHYQQQATAVMTEIEETQLAKEKEWDAVCQALQPLVEHEEVTISEETIVADLKRRMEKNKKQETLVQEAQQKIQTFATQQGAVSDKKQQLIAAETAAVQKRQIAEARLGTLVEQLSGYSIQQIETQLEQLAFSIKQDTAKIETDTRQGADIEKAVVIFSEKVANLKKILEEKQIEAHEAKHHLAAFLQAADCSEDQFEELLLTLSKKEALLADITSYQQDLYAIKQRLSILDQQLAKAKPADVQELADLCQQLQAKREQQQEQVIQKQEKLRNNQQIYQELQAIYTQNVQALDQLSQLQQLAETINGENSKKTSLERFVLQRYLTEILVVANERLARLTMGRYQFELADKVGSYRSSTGLEIDIYDDNAGQVRRAHTLSGGESFIAALALAISLADVIQAKAGGIEIEALFIDEGFGSLDEESLEMAMEALEMIESEGRMIGIISHVRELRTRITQQVYVETNGGGQSRIRIKE